MIQNEREYKAALARLDEIFDAEDEPECSEAAGLCYEIYVYEEENYPIHISLWTRVRLFLSRLAHGGFGCNQWKEG